MAWLACGSARLRRVEVLAPAELPSRRYQPRQSEANRTTDPASTDGVATPAAD